MTSDHRNAAAWGAFPLSRRQSFLIGISRYAPLGRRSLRKAALAALASGDETQHFDIEVKGIRTRCHLDDNASERKLLLEGGRKDRVQLRLIMDHLGEGATFVDVGANVGLYSLRAAKAVGSTGRVLAIEPNPEMAQRLHFNLTSNAIENVAVEAVAIGEERGEALLSFDPKRKGAATLAADDFGSSRKVAVIPLRDLLIDHALHRVDVLKIDVEGYEDRALLPFFATAPEFLWPRMLLMEVSWSRRWLKDCVEALSGLGYQEIWRGRDDAAFVRRAAH